MLCSMPVFTLLINHGAVHTKRAPGILRLHSRDTSKACFLPIHSYLCYALLIHSHYQTKTDVPCPRNKPFC